MKMKEVLLSTQPKWCEKIGSGEKEIEVRKTRPKEVPFKCYIYCTKTNSEQALLLDKNGRLSFGDYRNASNGDYYIADGKVIGEFICDSISEFHEWRLSLSQRSKIERFELNIVLEYSCLTYNEICKYRENMPYYKPLYLWNISNLVIYDKPKELSEFGLIRPPQSWQYVLEK